MTQKLFMVTSLKDKNKLEHKFDIKKTVSKLRQANYIPFSLIFFIKRKSL